MTSHHFSRAALVAALLTVVLLTLTPLAAAQDVGVDVEDGSNATETETSVVGHVGPITIQDYRLVDGTFVIDVDVTAYTQYSVTDALDGTRDEGLTSPAFKTGSLQQGQQQIRLDVAVVDGAGAVTIGTSNDLARLQTEAVDAGNPPVDYGTVQGLLGLAVVGSVVGTYRFVKKKREDEDHGPVRHL